MNFTMYKKIKILSIIMFLVVSINCNYIYAKEKGPDYWKSDSGTTVHTEDTAVTHTFLVEQAIKILKNDKKINYYDKYQELLVEYANKPDIDETDFYTNVGHFYDPDTGKNYLGNKSPTARTRVEEHIKNSKEYFNNKKADEGIKSLGRALHYLADVNVPHHSANKIAVLTNHSEYEKWADENDYKYKLTTGDIYNLYNDKDIVNYASLLTHNCAVYSKKYIDDVLSNDQEKWEEPTKNCLGYAQKSIAALLYNYYEKVIK